MAGKAPALRRHRFSRRLATLAATVVYLEARVIDDALELFDVLMVNDLMARAQRQSTADKVRQYPRVARDAARCAAAVAALLECGGVVAAHIPSRSASLGRSQLIFGDGASA
jgi:hypothetical protein